MTSTSSSRYLAAKTSSLASRTPVDPSQARAAQIPLQSFNLPTFPVEAFTAGLTSLTLTSDVKLDEYTALLAQPFSVPDLPLSIKNLTLELFSLGFPPGFLTELGKNLPDLKSLTLYSQLFLGTTPASKDDALTFIKSQSSLQELHLLDVFAAPGNLAELATNVSPALRFLEINYTYRHSDPQFLASIPSKDIGAFIGKNVAGLTMSISSPDVTDDLEDREGTEEGILPVTGKGDIVEKLVKEAGSLILLDMSMFLLTTVEVAEILDANQKVKVLGFTASLESGWEEVLKMLGSKERVIEVLEIVGVPGEEMVEKIKEGEHFTINLLEHLDGTCGQLKSVKVSILRTKVLQWIKEDGTWKQA